MPLTLTVPAPDRIEDPGVEIRPKQLEKRLNALPLTNFSEVSRILREDIGALNRQKIAMDVRLQLLEAYNNVILKLMPALEDQFVTARLPLQEKPRQMVELALHLQAELATGHKIILLDYQNKRIKLGKGKIALTAAQRGMSALSRILAIHYQIYAPAPAGIWSEIHQIFRFAMEQKIADGPGADNDIGPIYKQALLLALSDPYHLNPGEIRKIQEYLVLFGDLVQLQAPMQSSDPIGRFLVQIDSDSPPSEALQILDEASNLNSILLNTQELAHALRHHAGRLETGESPKNLHLPDSATEAGYHGLLRRLLKHWLATPKRTYRRTQRIAGTEVCTSLPALHHFLGGHDAVDSADLTFTATTKESQFISGKWLIVNESAGGLALRGIFKVLPQIRPGEIIGLKMEGSDRWHVGAVRWVKSDKARHLEIGAQLLAPKAMPTAIKPSICGPADEFTPALLLPEAPLLRQPETLVARHGTFGAQRELLLKFDDNTTETIRAVKLVEQTASFDRFEFSRER
ncbi:MAG: hypothetical protein LLG15_03280 [Betaproteobacteria bacterium]|nr:hypothetical protein [Betaproteobacteria bacterium]